MGLNPIQTYQKVTEDYLKYLKTLFFSKNDYINRRLEDLITPDRFTKGPYIEQIYDFEKGKSVDELIEDGVLHQDIKKILKSYELKSLYFHQEEVVKKAIIENKNIIISTGTGSGKTLSFLLPVIDFILKNPSKGVKALFLYPMNALVNDQLKDLRKRLKNLPHISFGRYTGETPYKAKEALERFKEQKIDILENERRSREEIIANPPDILITNYSMLEFLLLRPKDTPLFEGKSWRFIVLDEIHTYDGAKGSEIGYLIRRLKDRVARNASLHCIGASATLGNRENDEEVCHFAEGIFGEKFEKDSIIRARYREPEILDEKGLWKFQWPITDIVKKLREEEDSKKFIQFLKSYRDFDCNEKNVKDILKEFLENNSELNRLKKLLLQEPLTIQELSDKLNLSEEEVASLIELGFKAQILNAKYHFFVKASDGLYAILKEDGDIEEIFFDKRREYNKKKVFELSSCKGCGEIFITGYLNKKGFIEIGEGEESDIFRIKKESRIYLTRYTNNVVEDEDEANKDKNVLNECYLNVYTGEYSTTPKEMFVKFLEIETFPEQDSIKYCPYCGKRSKENLPPINYRFVTGDEIPQSVLLLSLYHQLPKQKKKSLVFSDSRKDAAFFAPFFERIYKDSMNRRKVLSILKRERREISYKEMVEYLYSIFNERMQKQEYEEFLIREFSLKDEKSLENIGLIKFVLDSEIEQEILSQVRFLYEMLLEKDIKSLIYTLLLTMRESFAIDAELDVGKALDIPFKKTPCFKEKNDGICKGWIGNNKRVDFVSKILNRDQKKSKEVLKKIWDAFISAGIFSNEEGERRLNITKWKIANNENLYRCKKCKKVHIYNVRNRCRVFKCNGELESISKDDLLESKYYLDLYENNLQVKDIKNQSKMVIEEHTAQLEREKAQEIQQKFDKGEINILSCSTTFELGVDIGTLESVFLHNIPPKPDNYVQRAGRAGRSSDSVAFILTFANRRSHDLKYFENPLPLIKGEIKTPVISLENIRIIRRHLNAIALASFLKKEFQGYNKITLKEFSESDGFKKFKKYLEAKPQEVKLSIQAVLPEKIQVQLGIKDWLWLRDTEEEKWEGSLDLWEKIEAEIKNDIDEYKNLKAEAVEEERYNDAQNYKKILDYYNGLDIIALLSKKIFIPKYGFPVDTVSLDTFKIKLKNLSLDRDMTIAIREYAPNEKVIANKKLIVSGKMKIIKGKMPDVLQYFFCAKCAYYSEGIRVDIPNRCPNCNSKIKKSYQGQYIIPVYGFEAEEKYEKIPMRKPISLSKVRSFFIGEDGAIEEKNVHSLKLTFAKRGKISVINIDKNIDINTGKSVQRSNYRLGYNFFTDVLVIENLNIGQNLIKTYSLLYALLEGASASLGIKREDIDGTIAPLNENEFKIVLYDNVPAGAGFMKAIFDTFKDVMMNALKIVEKCKCDEESCCPVCLEHISNQHIINLIQRGEAKEVLVNLLK